MGAAKTDDFFPDLRNPESIRIINERCLIRTQDEHRVVLVSGIVLAQYSLADQMAETYAMVSLVEQGWATQQDVARAFNYCARTVRRDQRRFEEGAWGIKFSRSRSKEARRHMALARIGGPNRNQKQKRNEAITTSPTP